MRVIAIANQKGGVGKTISTFNVGAGLARRKRKVLLIDLDRQGNLSMYALPSYRRTEKQADSIYSVCRGSAKFSDVIREVEENLSIIPAGKDLDELRDKAITFDFSSLHYDYVIFDCPPAMQGATVSAIRAADGAIIPVFCDKFSFESLGEISLSMKALGRKINGILITKFNSRLSVAEQVMSDIITFADSIKVKVYPVVRDRVAIQDSQSFRQNIFAYDMKSDSATDYAAVAEEILKEEK